MPTTADRPRIAPRPARERHPWLAAALAATVAVVSCGPAPPPAIDLATRAAELAAEVIVVDTHIDVPYRLLETWAEIGEATEDGQFDYPRALAGGLDAAFMSVYVPASIEGFDEAKAHADRLIDMVEGFTVAFPARFEVARSVADVRRLAGTGKIALPMGMENGSPIGDDLERLAYFHDRGIRYVTLTHSRNNQICDSSYADERTWEGLSPFGREVVAEMNRLGIMVDVSHISDAAFDQVMEVTRAPVIASHSSARHFTPGFERNMTDEQIVRMAEGGGVIQINFGSAFLTESANRQSREAWEAAGRYAEENGLDPGSEELAAFRARWREENPLELATVEDVADHIDHVVALVGVDHVGIGSDYDGVGPTTPIGLEDVSTSPTLTRELLERGYDEAAIAKICGENLLRVWSEVERIAAELQAASA